MPNRNLIVAQWKQMSQLKSYLSKFVTDKTVENALSHEIAQFLQKIQPGLSSIYFWKYLDSSSQPKKLESLSSKPEATTTLPAVTTKEAKKVVPKWKEARIEVSRESVAAQTHHILTLLASASSNQSILKRVEDLNAQLNKYSDAKHIAEKANAIRLLLRVKRRTTSAEIQGAVNEALALLGYAGPVKGKGVKILSIDGGGVRGILVIEMLKKLEELTGKRIQDMFDLICGVSTGAIIASLVSAQQHSLDQISEVYKTLSTQIFTQSPLKGTSSLVWSHSYYDTALWEKLLQDQIGDQTLLSTSRHPKCPKLCILSAVINQSSLSAHLFRNYTLSCRVHSKYDGSHKHMIWEAVRASAAAPTYFEEFKLGNKLHQDGGILYNNPTAVAIHEARLLWPEAPIQCVVSFGTGRTVPPPADAGAVGAVSASSWKSKFYAVIESATDTEGVHTMLSDLLPDRIYYRFNPYLTEMMDMAEIDVEKLEQMQRDVVMYLRRNEDKFQEAARVLNCEKGVAQRAVEWLSLQREIHGLKFVR